MLSTISWHAGRLSSRCLNIHVLPCSPRHRSTRYPAPGTAWLARLLGRSAPGYAMTCSCQVDGPDAGMLLGVRMTTYLSIHSTTAAAHPTMTYAPLSAEPQPAQDDDNAQPPGEWPRTPESPLSRAGQDLLVPAHAPPPPPPSTQCERILAGLGLAVGVAGTGLAGRAVVYEQSPRLGIGSAFAGAIIAVFRRQLAALWPQTEGEAGRAVVSSARPSAPIPSSGEASGGLAGRWRLVFRKITGSEGLGLRASGEQSWADLRGDFSSPQVKSGFFCGSDDGEVTKILTDAQALTQFWAESSARQPIQAVAFLQAIDTAHLCYLSACLKILLEVKQASAPAWTDIHWFMGLFLGDDACTSSKQLRRSANKRKLWIHPDKFCVHRTHDDREIVQRYQANSVLEIIDLLVRVGEEVAPLAPSAAP